jgi:preprotein translocase subunit SecA
VALNDEADSVLVDEALVPLVLAGTTHRETPKVQIVRLVGNLTAGVDYDTDADNRNVHLTEAGAQKVEKSLGGIDLYSEEHVATTLTEVNVALHAHVLLQRDVHYIVRDGAVQLINASRGRIAALQRWPDGLQAAVEVKEGIETTETGEVLDTITVQALINRYPTSSTNSASRRSRPTHPPCGRTNPTGSTSPPGPRTTPSSTTSSRPTPPGSRSWSAPRTSPNPKTCTSGCCAAAFLRWCSTPRTTKRKPG